MNDKEFRSSVASVLAWERMSRGITQQEIAERLGTGKSTISRIESGNQNITVDYAAAYAQALNLRPVFSLNEEIVPYAEPTDYVLKLYDEVLVEFTMDKDAFGVKCVIIRVNEDLKHLFPIDLELTNEGLVTWLRSRVIPQNREFVGNILMSFGLEISDLKGIIDVCKGLSLNDSYWVVPQDFDGLFCEYNLYQNRFSEALSLVAYAGWKCDTSDFRTSPELTTCGMLRKAWRFQSDGIWLYKGGTSDFANAGNEPYSEYLAGQVAEAMGLNSVHYELENWKGILASKCRLFTDIDTSFIPIGRIVKSGGIDACLDYYKTLGENFYQELISMLIFDAVVINEDRHFGNFGLLRNNKTGVITAPAPIFDNGISLLCYAMKSDFDSGIEKYMSSRKNPYGEGNNFIELAKSVMGPLQRRQLRKLINFRFADSDVANLPRWRVEKLESIIQDRVRMLLL